MASSVPVMFSKFNVTNAVFHMTPLSFAIVNLKPLLPGHVLVCPRRVTPRLYDLTSAELTDLMGVVTKVSRTLERVYEATGLNVAMQDGRTAGQTVPHVHIHLIPRKAGDLPEDKIHEMLEGPEADVGAQWAEELWDRYRTKSRPKFDKMGEDQREPRTQEEMREEADMIRRELAKDESEPSQSKDKAASEKSKA